MLLTVAACAGVGAPEPTASGDSARQVARSIWAVVPDPPARKADLRPDLIAGSAVAVNDRALLADCGVLGRGRRVGLVRHNKYRFARLGVTDVERRVCGLEVEEGPLTPIAGRRSFADLQVGEAVFAFTSRTSADLDLARGWLAGKSEAGEPFLETTLVLPANARSAVLFDDAGNLVGFGAGTATPGSLVLASPLAEALAPQVALRDAIVDPSFLLLTSLAPLPRDRLRLPPQRFPLAADRSDDTSAAMARTAAAEPAAPAGAAAARPEAPTDDRGRRGVTGRDDGGRGSDADDGGRGRDRDGGRGKEGSGGRDGRGGRDDDGDDDDGGGDDGGEDD